MERKSQNEKRIVSRPQLKYERERRGWTLDHVATLINCPDPHMIARWERGTTAPSPRYRQALCELFGKDAEQLGFISREPEKKKEQSVDQPLQEVGEEHSIVRPHTHFFFNEKLPRPDEFYGRGIEREILLNRTYNKSSTSLVGSRRIGKTWLIEYLLLEAKIQLGSRYHIGYVDATMASCSTVAGFTAKAAKELGFPLTPERAKLGLVALEDIVETLKAKGHHAVLCIDEFEGFTGKPEFDINFFASLRAMAQMGLCLVAASRRPLIDIVGDYGNTSGFFNIFEQLTLEPFEKEDAEDFVMKKSALVGFNEQEQEALMNYGRLEDELWPPIRLQLVGKMLLEDKTLETKNAGQRYRPDNPDYWQKFALRLEEKYRGVVR
ncbi:MAG: AAA family ATPase [Ktedonobacteraceae bacterium]|nr:AAA family ATPase [Ktedonobacteraceae bacterium]